MRIKAPQLAPFSLSLTSTSTVTHCSQKRKRFLMHFQTSFGWHCVTKLRKYIETSWQRTSQALAKNGSFTTSFNWAKMFSNLQRKFKSDIEKILSFSVSVRS